MGPSLDASRPPLAGAVTATCARACTGPAQRLRTSPRDDHVVDLQDHAHRLRGHLEAAGGDQQRLDHFLLVHVGDDGLLHVDARKLLPGGVGRTQLRHDLYRVHACVLRERVWHQLQRLRVVLDANGVDATQGPGPLQQLLRHLHLRRTASGDQRLLLDQASHDAEGIVDGPLGLVQQELVGGADEHRDAAARAALQAREAHDGTQVRAQALLVHELSLAQLLRCESFKARCSLHSQHLGNKLNVIALNVPHYKDLGLRAEVQGQVSSCIPQDGLLDQQDVAAGLGNLLHHLGKDGALLPQEPVHGGVVPHLDVALHVRLWSREAELNEANLGVLHPRRPAGNSGHLLCEHEAVHELGVVCGAPQLLHQPDIAQIHVRGSGRVDDLQHRVHGDARKLLGALGNHFGVQ
mmetsp:Transcript_4094/g.11962  ORF Transcript_4094/g.11962 Transcript_4094/m.11962 type:complete len:408 (+) Transcript_4094:510-1733(+)